ncbi:hypothetical protein VIGAN_03150900, partial [Vigna angularis var. angularis]
MENGETISQWWKLYFLKFGIFVKRLLNKDYQKRLTTAQALSHPWLTSHCDDVKIPFDMIIHKLVKSLYTLIFFTQISYGSILDRTQQNTMCKHYIFFIKLGYSDYILNKIYLYINSINLFC